ncbi:MliC family protein [uncultured Roseibium sp.]|uniref:MliC family protein n=1 Tax=uncultured Roseibium sp. TaxID=1936171 RepID=UPI002616F165|nr:MliC family protein [uncultured Roseibium sp.]
MKRFSIFVVLAMFLLPVRPILASPDVDFPQEGQSYGGKVRSGPGMQYQQVGSLYENDRILILNATGVMMNGYEWFQIRYGNGRTGYQWGGLLCSQKPYQTIYQVCAPRQSASNRPVTNSAPAQSQVNGYNASQVFHSGGSFSQAGGGQWEELNDQGRVAFRFQEQNRDEWSVYLFDASRNVSLQLDLHRKQVLYGIGNQGKTPLYAITNAIADVVPQANTNVIHVQYTCPEGLPLDVTYYNEGDGYLLFGYDSPEKVRLDQVPSGSGALYSNGRYSIHSKGDSVAITTPGGTDVCHKL